MRTATRPRRTLLRAALVAASAGVLALSAAAPAAAAQTVTYQIQASALGQTGTGTLNQDVDATGPATVAAGGALTVVITPAPNTVPTSVSGYTVRDIKDLKLMLPVPANSSYVSASLSGGSNLGGTPTVGQSGGNVVLTVPGPIAGGAQFQLPAVTLNLTAGSSGTIVTKLGGTSFSDPGLTFTADITASGLPVSASAVGYPDPNPTLTSTTIG